MALVEISLPRMGESITEATILNWNKSIGDYIELEETLCEIATDKVDSDVPSTVSGTVKELKYEVDDVVEVGAVIAVIETEGEETKIKRSSAEEKGLLPNELEISHNKPDKVEQIVEAGSDHPRFTPTEDGRFMSPLVRSIAEKENISDSELHSIHGTGMDGKVTKQDVLDYLEKRKYKGNYNRDIETAKDILKASSEGSLKSNVSTATKGKGDTVIQMDRMRRLIAEHMVNSKRISPHVTSFLEIDVTNMVEWRSRVKDEFQKRHDEKITYMPVIFHAVSQALRDFPLVNVQVDGDQIIVKRQINIGMATALPNGNLIVPVVKDADEKNLVGLTKSINDLAERARKSKLKGEEIQDGTFTVTNIGTMGNDAGMPIINQPQCAILAVGRIKKKPAVVETDQGDFIAIRHMMILSLSYDHRVIDGFLGGSFLRRIGDYLEDFDLNTSF